jgi:hypothetical protein
MHLGQVYTTKDLEEEKKPLWCNFFMHASATIMNTEMKCIIKKFKKTCGCKLVHFWNYRFIQPFVIDQVETVQGTGIMYIRSLCVVHALKGVAIWPPSFQNKIRQFYSLENHCKHLGTKNVNTKHYIVHINMCMCQDWKKISYLI